MSGRELPRTRVASRDRIDRSRGSSGGRGGRLTPARVVAGRHAQAAALVRCRKMTAGGAGGPEEAGELAGDGDGRDGGAFAVFGEVAVAMMQPNLGLPGARVTLRSARLRPAGRVLVGPGGLDQQPAGVAVAGLGDVPAVLLITGGVLAWGDAQAAHQLARGGRTGAKSPISAISPSAVRVEIRAKAASQRHRAAPVARSAQLGRSRRRASRPSRSRASAPSAAWAARRRGAAEAAPARWRMVHALPSR